MRLSRLLLCLLALTLMTGGASPPAEARANAKVEPEKRIEEYPYRRVDFDLKGSKCSSCIRRVVRKVRKSKGVLKADISIKKPYSGVIIFDRKKTDFNTIKKRFKSDKVEAVSVEIEDLKSLPSLLIPKALMRKLKKHG